MRALPRWIFMSRWLQAPLYVGLIVAQGIYVWQFWKELIHLIGMMTVEKTVTETECQRPELTPHQVEGPSVEGIL
jgi:uncharacterized protein (TIGR00645 family)